MDMKTYQHVNVLSSHYPNHSIELVQLWGRCATVTAACFGAEPHEYQHQVRQRSMNHPRRSCHHAGGMSPAQLHEPSTSTIAPLAFSSPHPYSIIACAAPVAVSLRVYWGRSASAGSHIFSAQGS